MGNIRIMLKCIEDKKNFTSETLHGLVANICAILSRNYFHFVNICDIFTFLPFSLCLLVSEVGAIIYILVRADTGQVLATVEAQTPKMVPVPCVVSGPKLDLYRCKAPAGSEY